MVEPSDHTCDEYFAAISTQNYSLDINSCFISDQTVIQIEFSPNYLQERSPHDKNNKLPDPYDNLFDYPIYSAPDNEYIQDLDFESFDYVPSDENDTFF